MSDSIELVLPEDLYERLRAHLFPGDGDEHGAVIAAGLAESKRGTRLLARDLFLAQDGIDYVPGQRGFRMLVAGFVRDCALYCRDERLAYLAIHNHCSGDAVGFSAVDLESHERGYPALLDVVRGSPVGGLVLAENALAGDIWFVGGARRHVRAGVVVGRRRVVLRPGPRHVSHAESRTYSRQSALLGQAGQELLGKLKVGVIGAGGAGSLIVEMIARLGVGWIVVADPDWVGISNLPRLTGSRRWDARWPFSATAAPAWLRRVAQRFAVPKVRYARRIVRRACRSTRVEALMGNVTDPAVANQFTDCDYLFLAADSMQARLVFNALVYQYLIPGFQVGAKAIVAKATGSLTQVYSVSRPVTPLGGCLRCNELISAAKLQEEGASADEREQQRYVDDPEIVAPSVITLNAVATAHAANDFLFAVTSLTLPSAGTEYQRFRSRERDAWLDEPRADEQCTYCGSSSRSRRARGDGIRLPTKLEGPPAPRARWSQA